MRCGATIYEDSPGSSNFKKKLYCSLPCFKVGLRKTREVAFAEKVDKGPYQKGCWLWRGSIKPRNGYGHMHAHGKDYNAHRLAYELAKGPIPSGMEVMHSCDVPHCVNPAHLSIGTHLDNMRDAAAKGRTWRGGNKPRRQYETV